MDGSHLAATVTWIRPNHETYRIPLLPAQGGRAGRAPNRSRQASASTRGLFALPAAAGSVKSGRGGVPSPKQAEDVGGADSPAAVATATAHVLTVTERQPVEPGLIAG